MDDALIEAELNLIMSSQMGKDATKIIIIGHDPTMLHLCIEQIRMTEGLSDAIVAVQESVEDFGKVYKPPYEEMQLCVKRMNVSDEFIRREYTNKPKRTGKSGFNSARNRVII